MFLRKSTHSSTVVVAMIALTTAAVFSENRSAPAMRTSPPERPRTIFDDLDRSRKISFAIDASRSMIQKMATLKDQVNKAIVGMSPEQSFGLVFFQNFKCAELNIELLPANAANKHRAALFLEGVRIESKTNPIPGLEAVFLQNPEVIYLVTDGDFPDNAAVLKKIRELNKDKKVTIHTIAFVGQADSDTDFITLLKTIAAENRGQYRNVNEADL